MSLEYQIAVRGTVTELESLVNTMLKEGWRLQGGVSCGEYAYTYESNGCSEVKEDYTFCQAMVRELPQAHSTGEGGNGVKA